MNGKEVDMATTDTSLHHPSHQAYQLLHIGFTIAPILAGLDKFFHILTDWNQYLAPFVTRTLGIDATTFMMVVGVIEIVAGVLVWLKPRFGGYLVAAWLWAIIINLLLIP